jgi:hypothetical protein
VNGRMGGICSRITLTFRHPLKRAEVCNQCH